MTVTRRDASIDIALLFLTWRMAASWPAPANAAGGVAMADRDARLVGAWQKTSGGACAAGYAAHLRFQPNGLYFGNTDPPGAFTWWDGGTWQVPEPGRLALSTANDAVVTYRYVLDGDTLSVTDPSDCQFSYRRSG
jgi:hypothetical protein